MLLRSGTPVESLHAVPAMPRTARSARVRLCIRCVILVGRYQKLALSDTKKLRLGGYGVTSWNRPIVWFEKFETSGS